MATRIKEGMIPYTGGDGIEITDNHVINVLLRAANNLIHVNEDRELYVDLQLPAGIAPDDEFPVGVTTGEILAEDGWEQSGTIINSKTTSGDYVRLIYANDGNLYYDPGTGERIMIGAAAALDVNTKTFFLSGLTGDENTQIMKSAIDWMRAGKNALIVYNRRCYTLIDTGFDGEEYRFYFATSIYSDARDDSGTTYTLYARQMGDNLNAVSMSEYSYLSYGSKTRAFRFDSSNLNSVKNKQNASLLLEWYTNNNIRHHSYYTEYGFGVQPIVVCGGKTYNLIQDTGSELKFASSIYERYFSSIKLGNYVDYITIAYSNTSATSISSSRMQISYKAGTGITIDSSTNTISANIQGALVYKGNVADVASLPSSGNTVGDVYYVEADGLMYARDGTARKAVGNTQVDLSNYFNVTTNTTDDITQGSTNLFVTQAMIDGWNGKQGALTAGTNIQINNGVISATDTTYSAGTGIGITGTTISNTMPFNPENAGSVGQVLKRTSTGVRWSNEFFENVFVTQAEYDALPSSKLTDGKTYFIYS